MSCGQGRSAVEHCIWGRDAFLWGTHVVEGPRYSARGRVLVKPSYGVSGSSEGGGRSLGPMSLLLHSDSTAEEQL